MRCNICRLNSNKYARLGRTLLCEECLHSINQYLIYRPEYTSNHEEFEILFHADMSLRIFRKTFPETCKLDGFQGQLKSLRRQIESLEGKVDKLPTKLSLHAPMKAIIDELKVLHSLYC